MPRSSEKRYSSNEIVFGPKFLSSQKSGYCMPEILFVPADDMTSVIASCADAECVATMKEKSATKTWSSFEGKNDIFITSLLRIRFRDVRHHWLPREQSFNPAHGFTFGGMGRLRDWPISVRAIGQWRYDFRALEVGSSEAGHRGDETRDYVR